MGSIDSEDVSKMIANRFSRACDKKSTRLSFSVHPLTRGKSPDGDDSANQQNDPDAQARLISFTDEGQDERGHRGHYSRVSDENKEHDDFPAHRMVHDHFGFAGCEAGPGQGRTGLKFCRFTGKSGMR